MKYVGPGDKTSTQLNNKTIQQTPLTQSLTQQYNKPRKSYTFFGLGFM